MCDKPFVFLLFHQFLIVFIQLCDIVDCLLSLILSGISTHSAIAQLQNLVSCLDYCRLNMRPLSPKPCGEDAHEKIPEENFSELHHRSLGLEQNPKNLFGYRYLYDDWGSQNYDDACVPPYYVFESEKQLLQERSHDLVQHIPNVRSFIEIGCGMINYFSSNLAWSHAGVFWLTFSMGRFGNEDCAIVEGSG